MERRPPISTRTYTLLPCATLFRSKAVNTGYVADAGGIIAPGATPGTTAMEWHDGQRQVEHHLKVVEVAARHHIAVNAHEPVKDTGLRRTYPNWVAREDRKSTRLNSSH